MCKLSSAWMMSLGSICALMWMGLCGQQSLSQEPKSAASTQSSAAPAVEMPKDAGALLLLAAKLNGLTGEGVQPWHLKASYTLLDEQGAAQEQGTLEEYWAGPHKNRTTYTVDGVSQTTYVTEEGNFRSGSLQLVTGLALEANREFVQPLPGSAYIQHETFEKRTEQAGASKLACVSEKAAPGYHTTGFPPGMYCFNPDQPMLRIDVSAFGKRQAVRNALILFEGKYVPKDIRITEQGKNSLTAHLESLEKLPAIEEADFTPPADAKLVPKKIAISSGVAQGLLLKSVPPHYPEKAKDARVMGTVMIQIHIGRDGHVNDPEVVSGPPLLQQAALDAVKDWVYRPYLLNGETVEVDTLVNIVFNLAP